jgi:uroporphyrinogen decarboxylase
MGTWQHRLFSPTKYKEILMQHRDRFIAALELQPISGRVPHFELVFFLTMEAFGKVHPIHRNYSQWIQMQEKERRLHREEMAQIYIDTAERFEHSAIFMHPNPDTIDETKQMIDLIREKTGEKYFLTRHGDATFGIPSGDTMLEFVYKMKSKPDLVKQEAQKMVDDALDCAVKIAQHGGLDGYTLCSDYCMNTGPFLSPAMFSEFVTPYLKQLVQGYKELGFYVIKHTDGNILPILDDLLSAEPHALHSLDPQAGMDIASIKRSCGDKICLIGNVNSGLLDTGTEEEVVESVRYALKHGMPGGGYIFSTSNCIYTGMRLSRYELMLKVWQKEGNYSE